MLRRDNDLWVTLADSDKICVLDPADLSFRSELTAPSAPRQIESDGQRVWVQTALEAGIAVWDPAGSRWILVARSDVVYPIYAGSGSRAPAAHVSNSGNARLMLFDSANEERCILRFAASLRSFVVTSAGEVVVAFDGGNGVNLLEGCP